MSPTSLFKQGVMYTQAEHTIIDFISANPTEFLVMPIQQLATRLGVSDATVSRFARHAGFRDFKELKSAVAAGTLGPAEKDGCEYWRWADVSAGVFGAAAELSGRHVTATERAGVRASGAGDCRGAIGAAACKGRGGCLCGAAAVLGLRGLGNGSKPCRQVDQSCSKDWCMQNRKASW